MVTMILFREKESNEAETQREKQDPPIPVNIDFDEGTTPQQAQGLKRKIREAGAEVTQAAQDENVKTGRW